MNFSPHPSPPKLKYGRDHLPQGRKNKIHQATERSPLLTQTLKFSHTLSNILDVSDHYTSKFSNRYMGIQDDIVRL